MEIYAEIFLTGWMTPLNVGEVKNNLRQDDGGSALEQLLSRAKLM